ncbi:MAG: hypothetical protein CME21_07280 [Gemmatimonadetes bacterium]|jgi:ectoine hydroxylase-related dioxygenase (phytanoyl-CoA dioxygenase family)|nr:hypothetical protein [Gemmatimonadota bacterium]HCK10979.1 hypothetical protein [Candidatus Latescibacterota bacterium]
MNLDQRNWSELTEADRLRMIELEGYFVVPDLLDPDHVTQLKTETAQLETQAVDYSIHQQTRNDVQWTGGELTRLIGHRPTLDILKSILGDDLVFSHYAYARSEPGHPGISLHTDGQPYGSRIFGYEGSVPVMIRVLYYLDDLTEQVSPFRVLPRSHLSLHADGNPYLRYTKHPDEVTVTAKAGSALFLNHKVFHGSQPNVGDRPREMLAIAYRPTWAGPVGSIEEWQTEQLESLPEDVHHLFLSRNTVRADLEQGNKPAGMGSKAPGINLTRWGSK